ncbi:MAG: hypothetical protein GVY18_11100 [Bacteroidetes bacterium]|jgi:hypothetical protein|nr:hypothetical protein [Bacteroidota bacterium]
MPPASLRRPLWTRIATLLFLLLAVVLWPRNAYAQDDRATPVVLPRLSGPITLDGRSSEPAWETIDSLPLTVQEPTFGAAPTERTDIRIGYDDTHLYVSGRFYDSDPRRIRTNSLYRDRYAGDDAFSLFIDPFDDHENGLWLMTTPTGVRIDRGVSNDARDIFGDPFNANWDAFWDAETRITAEGWFAELRIPFSSLGFRVEDDRVVMGLITYRYIARKNERHIYPAISPDWATSYAKPSQAQDILLRGVDDQRPVHLTPYALGGVDQAPVRVASEDAFTTERTATQDLGLDAKVGLTSSLTLDLTVNTDFAQVEADDQQVNLDRFSIFFPEKRRFFQERAGLFAFRLGGADRLFYSRRIGLSDEGVPIPILGGARLAGRIGSWDLGALSMQTARHGGAPTENLSVLRVRRDLLRPGSYAGALLTSRLDADGAYNVAYGLDGVLQLGNGHTADVRLAQTLDQPRIAEDDFSPLGASLLNASLSRITMNGVGYLATLTRSGSAFEPGLGFVTRRDFTGGSATLTYGHFFDDRSPLRWVAPFLNGGAYLRNADGSLESAFYGMSVRTQWKTGAASRVAGFIVHEDLRAPLALPGGVTVPTGRYRFVEFAASHTLADGRLLRAATALDAGTFYDGSRVGIEVTPTWNASAHLELSGVYRYERLRFNHRAERADLHVARLRAQVAFNARLSVAAFAQFSNASDLLSTNVRARYNVREGNDLWIVYDEGLHADRLRHASPLPRSAGRTLRLKYSHTFSL